MTATLECWVLPHERAPGAHNMAKDEAILDFVSSHPDQAVFRTYEWAEPTLSLGYFQSIRSAEAEARWNGIPIVRRMTGGGALWHDAELTYALILPRSHSLFGNTIGLYEWVHDAIGRVLSNHGVEASRRGSVPPSPLDESKPFLCFCDRDPNDIISQGHKIVGSAQRRRSGAILQHGSILIRCSERTPELPGILNLGENRGEARDWARDLSIELPLAMNFHSRPEEWPSGLAGVAELLAQSRYQSDDWTRRR